MDMPHMLAYTLHGTFGAGNRPTLAIGAAGKVTWLFPDHGQDDSYWICIIDAMNPRQKVKDWVVPGKNAAAPPDIDTYMNNPQHIFALATQNLSTLHVPQGPFYDFLAKYGAGRELQKLEQFNAVLGCGTWGRVAYCLTTQCGPREHGKPVPASYELGDHVTGTILMMSVMPQKNGAPPYGLCDSYTWTSPPAAA